MSILISPEVRDLLPSELIQKAERCGVRKISSSSWLYTIRRLFGFYHPQSREILIDPSQGARLLELYRKRHPELDVHSSEVLLLIFFHELAHASGIGDEQDAEVFALEDFKRWRHEEKDKLIKAVREAIKEGFASL